MALKRSLILFTLPALSLALALTITGCGRQVSRTLPDATDNHETGEPSGMSIYTDHGTGCQYLTINGRGLTPRLDANGRPICKASKS